MSEIKYELMKHERHLDKLYKELERRLIRYHRWNISKIDINRRLKSIRQEIIDTLVRIEGCK